MQAVVIVPTFDRPEMLWLCLDHLGRCPEIEGMLVRVCVDDRDDRAPIDEIFDVLDQHHTLRLEMRLGARHNFRGNSFNVMRAYQSAWFDKADWFYLVEDDVLVSPEFFAWHQRVHQEAGPAASVGVRDPGHGAYASLGVCMPRATLTDVQYHSRDAYFTDMRRYCQQTFPRSQFDCEQDGLIARVLAGRTVAWADPPVCSHVGWYGYHRKKTARPLGTLEERYQQVREAVDAGLPSAASDVKLATERNAGTYTLSTVPGGHA